MFSEDRRRRNAGKEVCRLRPSHKVGPIGLVVAAAAVEEDLPSLVGREG